MVFYLFRPKAILSGIPFPCSAQYRLWIQPRRRRFAKAQPRSRSQIQETVPSEVSASHQPR